MIKYHTFNVLEEFGTNSYIVWDEKSLEAIIIDPASNSDVFKTFISKENLKLKYLINTHGHLDHIGGNAHIKSQFDIPLIIHKDDADMLFNPNLNLSIAVGKKIISPRANILVSGDESNYFIGKHKIKFIHTPGHTKGSMCVLIDNTLISGDTLFYESIGRTDLPGASYDEIASSIKSKLFVLPDSTLILPGHGNTTSIENEKVGNPFVGMLSQFSKE